MNMTKEQVYEIQNKLIDESMNEVWITNKDTDNTKTLAYICGIRETIEEIIRFSGPWWASSVTFIRSFVMRDMILPVSSPS